MEIRKLSDYCFRDALHIWNNSFEDYLVDVSMTLEQFIARLAVENTSPEHCLVGVIDGKPIGLVRSGIKIIQGKKIAWNGGTAIAKEYRDQSLGRELMTHVKQYYKEQLVEIATLEAFCENQRAIKLYENIGYEIVDKVIFFENNDRLERNSFAVDSKVLIGEVETAAQAVNISFYDHFSPWQNQCTNIKDGLLFTVKNSINGAILGYALYRRVYDQEGQLQAVLLHQCHAVDNDGQSKQIIKVLLQHVFPVSDKAYVKMTVNLSEKNKLVVEALESAGFTRKFEQVNMHMKLA